MRKLLTQLVALSFILSAATGCTKTMRGHDEASTKKNVDVLFVGATENTSGFQNASANAKSHYELIRAARKAEELKDYDRAIKLLNEALPSAVFNFERGAIYMNLAEIYVVKNDIQNELKYQLLLSDNTGNENVRVAALQRADEIRGRFLATKKASEKGSH